MEASQVQAVEDVPQVKKRLYRNNTGGYVGVVVLDHKGEEQGTNIDPHGTIWLSDAEAILTARAPRRPEDNPFEEQSFITQDPETGRRMEIKMRPVTLVTGEHRYTPAADRYLPHLMEDVDAEARAHVEAQAHGHDAPSATTGATAERARQVEREGTDRPAPVRDMEQAQATPPPETVPPSTGSSAPAEGALPTPPTVPPTAVVPPVRQEPAPQGAAPQTGLAGTGGPPSDRSAAATEEGQSWVQEPEAPGQVLSGALGGSDEGAADQAADPTQPQAADQVQNRPQAAPQTPGGTDVGERYVPGQEEHAARVDPQVGEETGQAAAPSGPATEGEFARAEEVGSPDAPAAEGNDDAPLIGS